MDTYKDMKNEFSRNIRIDDSILNKKFEIKATTEECDALAERFKIHKIHNLKATYMVSQKNDIYGAYLLSMHLISKVSKISIESNSDEIDIDEEMDIVLLDEDAARNNHEQLDEYDIEILEQDMNVDVGEIAAQYLSLCIFM